MPRRARRHSSTGIYHIMLTGINRQPILEDREDNEKFIEILKSCKLISGYKLYAYCLMGNHLHLIIKTEKEPLEQIFKRICGRYVYWYNTKYRRTGPLFQDRFKSEPIEDEASFLNVLRFIHQNPVIAGLSDKPDEYPYSSYGCYTGCRDETLIDTDFTLNILDRERFEEFHCQECENVYMDINERPNRLTDEQAWEIIKRISKCSSASEFKQLEAGVRNDCIRKLRKEGLSIRQISRLTGVGKGIVERFS